MTATSSDRDRLDRLRDFYAQHGILPSYQAIADLLGYRSTSAAAAMVGRLSGEGFLEKGHGGRVCPGKRFFERPFAVGSVPAGLAVAAEDLGTNHRRIDELLVRHPSRSIMVRVEGESMVLAGLLDGDHVVVELNSPANIGDIVVAIVDGKATVKYLAHEKGQYYLRPGNPKFQDIWPEDGLQVLGLVVGSFRKMH